MKKRKKISRLIAIGVVYVLLLIAICHYIVVWEASGKTYDKVEDIPHNKVGLLLATSPITPIGAHNFYFENRIKAADELYKAGKIDFIIASGGDYTKSQTNGCDEPRAILDSLVARGIPADRIILDYDGTRTLNSISKAKEGYGLDSITLISQKYHNERAIYLADKYGFKVVGYNAKPSPIRSNRIKNTLREYFARVKMFIDNLTNNAPNFEKQNIDFKIPEKDDAHTNFLGLFYGMEKNFNGEYVDSFLDTIPEITHKEFSNIWSKPLDSVRFEMTLGIYLDNEYPSDAVRETVFKKLNSIIPEGFSYDIDNRQESLLKSGVATMQSVKGFLDGWECLFNKVSRLNGYGPKYANFPMIIGSRGCAVCHKIYEDSIWVTYIIEMSVDYHSSCGCPSSADYYTINKQSGKILTLSEFLAQCKRSNITDLIRREYENESKAKGFTPSDFSGSELLGKANGIAKLKEGVILYFHTYNIGGGAEGQYNLVLPVEK